MNTIRLVTDEKIKQIKYFYKRPGFLAFGTFFILGFGLVIPILISVAFNINALFTIVPFIAIVVYIDRSMLSRKVKRATEAYLDGDEITIYLESVGRNYGATMNGAPQTVINIRKGDELIKIKTFSGRVFSAFNFQSQKAYVYNKYPDILLPSAIFSENFYDPLRPKQKSRSISI